MFQFYMYYTDFAGLTRPTYKHIIFPVSYNVAVLFSRRAIDRAIFSVLHKITLITIQFSLGDYALCIVLL